MVDGCTGPIVAIASSPTGHGYWLITSNEVVFGDHEATLPSVWTDTKRRIGTSDTDAGEVARS